MSLDSSLSTQENIVIPEQQKILNSLKEEIGKLPNSCSIQELESGQLRVKLESYVIELIDGKLDQKARVISINQTVEIGKDLVPFNYSKFQQDSWNFQIEKILKGEKETRSTIPLFRVNTRPGTTIIRLGHLYPNSDQTIGSTGGVFGLLPDYQTHENPSRYFPDDSTEGLNISEKISTIQFDIIKFTGDILDS